MTTCLEKELFIWFTVRVIRERLSIYVCVLLSLLVLRVGIWDLIVLIHDHCLSIYFFFNSSCDCSCMRSQFCYITVF